MMVDLIPAFTDNYIFAVKSADNKECLIVDPGSAFEVEDYLQKNKLSLKGFLITHHHPDHIGGLSELLEKYPVPVFAPEKNQRQIPQGTVWLKEGDRVSNLGFDFVVLELPGHTLGHIAFYEPARGWLFSGDVLFGLGCGRLFEGTPEQGFTSLQRIKALPDSVLVFCAHEYTETNLSFLKSLAGNTSTLPEYEKELFRKRHLNQPSVPLSLGQEKESNPFLRSLSSEEFKILRAARNNF